MLSFIGAAEAGTGGVCLVQQGGTVKVEEMTITELQEKMDSDEYSARAITGIYLERIEEIDKQGPKLNAIIELNPDALEIADSLDAERKEKGARGPMHGIGNLERQYQHRRPDDDHCRVTRPGWLNCSPGLFCSTKAP